MKFALGLLLGAGFIAACVTGNDQVLLVDNELRSQPEATPTPVPQPESVAQAIPPPVNKVTQGKVLAMPSNTSLLAINTFLREYKPVYEKFGDLLKEYRTYFVSVNTPAESDEAGIEAIRTRIREDFEKAHWVFVLGCDELNEYLSVRAKGSDMSDVEDNFVARMKTITVIAKELSVLGSDKKYEKFARELYVRHSEKQFGRTLQPLKTAPVKPAEVTPAEIENGWTDSESTEK